MKANIKSENHKRNLRGKIKAQETFKVAKIATQTWLSNFDNNFRLLKRFCELIEKL